MGVRSHRGIRSRKRPLHHLINASPIVAWADRLPSARPGLTRPCGRHTRRRGPWALHLLHKPSRWLFRGQLRWSERTGQARFRPLRHPSSSGTCQSPGNWGTPQNVIGNRRRLESFPACGVALAVSAWLLAPVTLAQSNSAVAKTGIDLSYDAPPGCGSREAVSELLRQSLGSTLDSVRQMSATVTVRPTGDGLLVSFAARHEGGSSERQLVVADCAAVVEASALLLALAIDPVLGQGASGLPAEDPDPAPERNTTAPTEASPPTSGPKPPERRAPQTVPPVEAQPPQGGDGNDTTSLALVPRGGWLGGGGGLVTALAPRTAQGVFAGAGLEWRYLKLGVDGVYAWVAKRDLEEVPGSEVRSQLYRIQGWIEPTFRFSAVELGPVLGFNVEHLWATVDGISKPGGDASTWGSLSLGANLDVNLWRGLNWRLKGAAVFSLQQPKYTVLGLTELIHQPGQVGVEASTGLIWSWGAR